MSEIGLNELGYDAKLYVLAFDHRGSFERMVGGGPEKVAGAKRLIWEGFQRAVADGAPKDSAGILVDGQYGPTWRARRRQAVTCSPCPSRSRASPNSISNTATRSVSRSSRSTRTSRRCSFATTRKATAR